MLAPNRSLVLPLLATMVAVAACQRGEPAPGDTTAAIQTGPAAGTTTAAAAGRLGSALEFRVAEQSGVGSYLTDGNGRAVYLFEKDANGVSHCYDDCAVEWPPVMAPRAPTASGNTVQARLLGVTTRRDSTRQATYAGAPLYYYSDDAQPGDINGQDKKDFGAEWYLVSPSGGKQEGKAGGS